jgi:AraC-like DNA-binding protein
MTAMPDSIYNALNGSYWITVSRYYSIHFSSSFMPFHSHPEAEIMYAAAGQCTVFLETGESFLMNEGDYVFLDSGVSHRLFIMAGVPCRVLNIEGCIENSTGFVTFKALTRDEKFSRFMQARQSAFFSHDKDGIVRNSLVGMHRMLDSCASAMELHLQLSLIFTEMGRQYALNACKQRRTGIPHYIKQSVAYINENYDQEISVEDIAEATGVSKSHLHRTFLRHTNSTIWEMVNGLRLNKALYLLETTGLSIVDIAVSVGFSSRSYFTDLFTRTFKISPARYRKHRGGLNIARGHDMDNFTVKK